MTRRPRSTLHSPAMSRPLLERTVRERVEALAPVGIRDRTTVAGLATDATGTRVTGVRLQDGSSLAGDLVVDAPVQVGEEPGDVHRRASLGPCGAIA